MLLTYKCVNVYIFLQSLCYLWMFKFSYKISIEESLDYIIIISTRQSWDYEQYSETENTKKWLKKRHSILGG